MILILLFGQIYLEISSFGYYGHWVMTMLGYVGPIELKYSLQLGDWHQGYNSLDLILTNTTFK